MRVSATGPPDAQRITWSLSDGQNRFKILLEHRTNPDGQPAHTITVYADHADQRERIMEEYRSIAYTGTDSDSPGTELAASLDQLSLEDLLNVLEHLRSPYKPTHAYYLQHVQAALARKKAFRQWMIDNVPIDTSSVLATDPYTQLSRSEDQDYSALSYPCVFSSVWAEVKMSNPPKKPLITDLFAEDDLAAKFKIVPEALANRGEVPDLDSDSPATDIEALRALERVGFEPLFEADKNVVEIVPKADPAPLSCAEFEAVIAKWMEVKDLSPDGIREALEAVKVADGKTAWDVVSGFKTHVKGWLKILSVDVPALDWVVMTKKDFFKLVGKKVPFLARLTTLQTFISIEFVFTIPFEMWMDFAEAQVQTSQVWYLKGRVTAFRQWLRELSSLARLKGADFPSTIEIDLTKVFSLDPYFIDRYINERSAEGLPNNPAAVRLMADEFKEGFDDQTVQMAFLGEWLIRETSESLAELMRQSDLDSCKVEVLRKAGILDLNLARAEVLKQFADDLVEKLPRI